MRKENIWQTVINKLLDKYEKSKTFMGTNQVNQSFTKSISEMFSIYNDDAEYDLFCDVNEALREMENMKLVTLTYTRGDIINKVSLNIDMIHKCYEIVGREPKKEENQWLLEAMEKYSGNDVLDKYFYIQRSYISKNKRVEYFDGNKKEYMDLLKLVSALLANEEEQFVRDFSIKLFRDSKKVEKLEIKARALLYQYGDFQDKDSVFEECNVLKTPTYLCIKGKGVIILGNQTIDLSLIDGDIALSTASLKELKNVIVTGSRVVTVENLTSFHNYAAENDFVIYLGGFHNKIKRRFLVKLYESNPDKEYRHFGDIDAGGFYILEHLKAKTGINFKSMYMDKKTMEKYICQSKPLTGNDRKRIKSLLMKLTGNDKEVLEFMLEKGCKLEQEAVKER